MHLYRIAQEAINNAATHGKARNVSISLNTTDESMSLEIADDGVGISQLSHESSGMGLKVMQYRARLSGGELQVRKGPHGGTVVSYTSPNPNHEANETVRAA